MSGVDSVESSSRTKAAKKRMDKGVAGRNMVMASKGGVYDRVGIRTASDRLSRLGNGRVEIESRRECA